jgi:(p)ppGpp synthase/HD superfamily hydrolase
VAESASTYTDEDRVQPDFEPEKRRDEAYRAEYMAELYEKAGHAQAELTRIVNQLAEDNNGEAHARKELKKLGRANDKIDKDYDGDASRLVDVAGAYIQFDKVKDIYAALAVLAAEPNLEIVKFKDRFAKPMGSGYRDLQMSVQMSNGHIAELRLHLKSLDEITVYEHAVYEVRRDLDSAAFDDGDRPLTADEAALRDALIARERDLFWTALQGGL